MTDKQYYNTSLGIAQSALLSIQKLPKRQRNLTQIILLEKSTLDLIKESKKRLNEIINFEYEQENHD